MKENAPSIELTKQRNPAVVQILLQYNTCLYCENPVWFNLFHFHVVVVTPTLYVHFLSLPPLPSPPLPSFSPQTEGMEADVIVEDMDQTASTNSAPTSVIVNVTGTS